MERGRIPGRPSPARGLGAGLMLCMAATTLAPVAFAQPSAPTGVTARPRPGAILVSWAAVPGAEGYHVYRSMSAGGPYAMLATAPCAPRCEFQDGGILTGHTYFYVVRAYDRQGHEGGSSAEARATGDNVPPGAEITSPAANTRFSGRGPARILGTAVDTASGVASIDVSMRRIDTGEWWTGSTWAAGGQVWLPVAVEGAGPTHAWSLDTSKVGWAQATAYRLRLRVRDGAGFELDPADGATIYVDAPAILTVSVAAAPGTVTVGQPVHVTVLVANTGGSEAARVEAVAPVVESRAGATAPAARLVGQPADAMVPALAPGEFATFSWTFSATAPGILSFKAGARGTDHSSIQPATVVPGISNEVNARLPARLETDVTVSPANVRVGTALTIRMRVTNAGQGEAAVTAAVLTPVNPGLVGKLAGPAPALPFRLREGESKDLVWTASATGTGTVSFTGAVSGVDEISGVPAHSAARTSAPAGIAGAPAGLQLAASTDAAVTGDPVTVTAQVRDEAGIPVPGARVEFGLLAGAGAFDKPVAGTDEQGIARATLTVGGKTGVVAVSARSGSLLASFSIEAILPGGAASVLSRNFFDPEKGETVDVRVRLPRTGRVKVRVFNLGGEIMATLADGPAQAGDAVYTWNGRNAKGELATNGVYFISVESGSTLMSRRVSVLRRP